MKPALVVVAGVLLAGAAWAQEGDVAARQSPEFFAPPALQVEQWPNDFTAQWYLRGEALWLHRSNSERVFLGEEQVLATGDVPNVLTTEVAEFDFEPGLRLVLGVPLTDVWTAELLYFGLQHWNESGSLANTDPFNNALFSNFLSLSGTLVDGYTYTYASEVHNGEANVLSNFLVTEDWRASFLTGFRYFYLRDEFTLAGAIKDFDTFEATRATTNNNLVGLQVGGGLARSLGSRCGFAAGGKAALYVNFADEHITNALNAPPAGGVVQLDARSHGATMAGSVEVGAWLSCRVCRNFIVRGGYELMFFNRLALAPEQLDSLNNDLSKVPLNITPDRTGNFLNDRGSAIFQGPFLGADLRW